ncbi:unnamed protein product [Blepharisma stoltei]|uniref:Histone-lysine N-methyltransferase, H3 lysine-79 specific n=1 Tax=Blepharisma stoltei TaxID=1481888 RepID=A0AAU9JV63_9CILI|nr:unnamed protein product [Blepharisma stoltei]
MDNGYRVDDAYLLPPDVREVLNRKYAIFQQITGNFPVSLGKDVSKKDREELGNASSTLTYGEVEFVSIGEIFETIKARYGAIPSGGVFYDLGSGTGKGVIAGALLHNFTECVGIEILEGLYDVSVQQKQEYDRIFPEEVKNNPELFENKPEVEFYKNDMFAQGWADASLIFANSTCFDLPMMEAIANAPVQPGTWALTLTKNFNSPKWRIFESIRKNMSWGEATVYIHQRLQLE